MPFDLPKFGTQSRIRYDYAITGQVDGVDTAIPLLAGQTTDYPYLRESGQVKQQIDTTGAAGEQSLSAWWYRSQASFHGGSQWPDELFLDDVQNKNLFTRYVDSCGVMPFVAGRVRLLNSAAKVRSISSDRVVAETVSAGGIEGTVVAHQSGGNIILTLVEDGTAADVYTITGQNLHDMASDGGALHVLTGNNIHRVVIGSWSGAVSFTGTTVDGKIGYVKDRLIVASKNELRELPDVDGSGVMPNAFYSSTVSTSRTIEIDEGPDMIYVSMLSGAENQILGITLDVSSSPPSLASPVPVGQLPTGEAITSMVVYLGSLLILGTTRGVRVGLVREGGSLTIGPLSLESDGVVSSVYALGDYIIASGAKHRERQQDGSIVERSGLYALDLGTRSENEFQFAWCNYLTRPGLPYTDTDLVTSIRSIGQSDKVVWTVENDGIYARTDAYVDQGYLITGKIRFNTSENKTFSLVRTTNSVTPGVISVEASFEDGVYLPVAAWDTTDIRGYEDVSPSMDPHLFMQLRITLAGDLVSTPLLTSYQVKALPANATPRSVRIVALNFEREMDSNGNTIERSSFDRLKAFEEMQAAGRVVLFQDMVTGEDTFCTIDSVQLVSQHISEGKERGGREGLLLLTLFVLDA